MKFWGAIDYSGRLVRDCAAKCSSFRTFGNGEYGHFVELGNSNNPISVQRGVHIHASGLIIAWAGRLVRTKTQSSWRSPNFGTEVADAYLRHGVNVWSDIVGEFAIAIWDSAERQLLLARDRMGAIPLYFTTEPNGTACFGDHCGLLAKRCGQVDQIDEGYVVSKICFLPPEPGATCFRRIRSIPPGSFAVISPQHTKIVRYWRIRVLESRSQLEWVRTFRERFEYRIRQVTELGEPVGVALSGGLDSSSVLRTVCKSNGSRVHAFTYRLEGIAESDELEYARAAVQGTSARLSVVSSFVDWPLIDLLQVAVEPDAVERYLPIATISKIAGEVGCVGMLTGTYGNLVGGYDGGWQLQLARSRKFARLLVEIFKNHRRTLNSRFRELLVTQLLAVKPSLVEVIRASKRQSRGGTFGSLSVVDDHARTAHRCDARELEYMKTCLDPDVPLRFVLHHSSELVGAPTWHSGLEIENITGTPLVDPFADVELLEIACSVPWSLRHGKMGDRILLRRAMQGCVPSTILSRVQVSPYSEMYGRQYRATLARPEIRSGLHVIEKIVGLDWTRQYAPVNIENFPVFEAVYRAGLIGAWLEHHRG